MLLLSSAGIFKTQDPQEAYPAFVNQYETQTIIDSACPAPATGSVCCPRPDGSNMLINLYQNATPRILYRAVPDEAVRQFEISINAANKSAGEGINVSIQPWQSYPDVANALDASTLLAGSVTLSNIGTDGYKMFEEVNGYYRFNVLTQTSLDDEGDHKTSGNHWTMTYFHSLLKTRTLAFLRSCYLLHMQLL